jgi:predicted Fe-Mo cluster-binding NifX family protein
MRIAITATGPDLEAQLDVTFGRCKYFVFVDPESLAFESVRNSAAAVSAGAGVPAALLVANRGADVVFTGEVGPAAAEVLKEAGISVFAGVKGTIREALLGFKKGKFQRASRSTVKSGFGLRHNK